VLALVFWVSVFHSPPCSASISQKREELSKTRKYLRNVKEKLQFSNVRYKDLSRQLNRTHKQINTLEGDIKGINKNIKLSEKDIKRLEGDLGVLRVRHRDRQSLLQDRLRDIFLNDDNDGFLVLMGSRSFSDFVSHSQYLGMVCESDEQLIKTLQIEQEAIRFKQQQIDEKYKRMLTYRGRLKQKKESLEEIEQTRESLLERVEKERKYYQERRYVLEGHTQELENEIQDLIRAYQRRANSGSSGSYTPARSTGAFNWPADGPVTSSFGWRQHPIYGGWRMHTGIDLGAGYGQPIRASDGGTVIYSGWCGGYGNLVMIDHGKGITTLYGHCSSISVSNGQSVSKGQVIARVGSTGNSTGPHLHFEVRQNGVPINPWGYLR
jgi:murein DD-endopeptidase MepM/ murein hydrolase activator NlpD